MKRILSLIFITLLLITPVAYSAEEALQIDALWSGIDNPANGQPFSGAIVAFFAAGTTTPKAVWENKEKTLPSAAGQFQANLDSNGQLKIFGDGVYKINIYHPNDTGLTTPKYTLDGSTYVNDFGSITIGFDTVASMSDSSGGDFDNQNGTLRGYYSPGDGGGGNFLWDSGDLATEVSSETKPGEYIAPSSDPTGASGAWVRQITDHVTPEMWGVDSINDQIEIQAAVDSLYAVELLGKTYNVASAVTLPEVIHGKLTGNVNTRIVTSATSGNILQTPSATNIISWEIDGIYFDGNSQQVTAIYWEGWKKSIIQNNYFYQCNVGVDMYNDAYYNYLANNKYRECAVGVRTDGDSEVDGLWPNSSTILGGSFELCDTSVDFQKAQNFRILASAIEQSVTCGVMLGSFATAVKVTDTRFESSTGDHYVFTGGTSDNKFKGNQYSGGAALYSGAPSKRDDFDDGYTWGGNNNAVIINEDGLIKFGAQNYVRESGLGLSTTQSIEFLLDVNDGTGFYMAQNPANGNLEMFARNNTAAWTRFLKVRQDNLNRTRIGDTGDPNSATLSSSTLGVDELTVEPAKQAGTISFADGTTWDPGAGKGFYGYDGTTWNKLD